MKWYHKSFCSCMAQRVVGRGKRRPNKTSSWNRTRGVIIVWAAFMLFAIVGVMGFGLDGARLYIDAHQLQNAADSAALAGAQYVKAGYLSARDGDPSNDFEYPAVVFRTAQEIANQNMATRAIVNLDVPNLSAFDQTADVVIGYYRLQNRQFTPYDPDDPDAKTPNAVKVVARQTLASAVNAPVPLIFGSIFGVDTANVVREAIAISTDSTGPGLIVLREWFDEFPETGTGLQLGGGAIVLVNDGDVQVNSWSDDNPWSALRMTERATLETEELYVVGGTSPGPDDPFWDTQDYNVNSYTEDPRPDPLGDAPALWSPILTTGTPPTPPGFMPLPGYGMAIQTDGAGQPLIDPNTGGYMSATNRDTGEPFDPTSPAAMDSSTIRDYGQDVGATRTLTLTPGYYPGGFQLTGPEAGGKKFKLLPGVYAVGGGDGTGGASGLVIRGGEFEALGVMIYATAAPGPEWAKVDLNGGEVTIYEGLNPDDWSEEPYTDYVGTNYKYIAIFQDRDNPQDAEINGNTFLDLEGTFYFPTAHMVFQGTGIEEGIQLIAGSMEAFGNTEMTINYDGRFFSAGFESLLVE
ncbi:MAG: pilus assembly protein TadG-related protein [Planctomycetota bacterium]